MMISRMCSNTAAHAHTAHTGDAPYTEQTALRILERLRGEARKDEWRGWLFVFGTIQFVRSPGRQAERRASRGTAYNIAPVVEGGPAGGAWFVPKRLEDEVDTLALLAQRSDAPDR
jgi:hypothetical protein